MPHLWNRVWNGAALLLCGVVALAPTSARAGRYSLEASGTISLSTDAAIPAGTPWTFQLIYEAAAPDLDFESTGSPTPTFGRFTNTGAPPALTSFHYLAGDYEVTLEDAADFGPGSDILITFGGVNAIDININAPALFPPLSGGAVSFHADFNDFSSRPIFASDVLPTDPAFGPGSFDAVTVSLLPSFGEVSGSSLASFAVSAVPEPSTVGLAVIGLISFLVARSPAAVRRAREASDG